MGVVEPYMNGIGGDLFAVIYMAKTGALHGLNSAGWTPKGLTPALMKAKGLTDMPAGGVHTVTVPGAVAGWESMRERFGTLSMADLLAPAIFYADDGFPVSEIIAGTWAGLTETLAVETSLSKTYFPNGRAPYAGEGFRNPDLARSLRLIAYEGPAAFSEGTQADRIHRFSLV